MRKLIPILICCLLFGMAAAPAYGEEQRPTIRVEVSGQQVKVAGSVLAPGKQVTLLVKNAEGRVEHIDQKASDAEAAYSFQFKIADPLAGNYTAYVGGDGFAAPISSTFTVSREEGPPTPSTPTPIPIPIPVPSPQLDPDLMIVNEIALGTGKDGIVTIEVQKGKKGVLLMAKAAAAVGSNRLDVVFGHATISITPEALQAVLLQLPEGNAANMGIAITAAPLPASETPALLEKVSKSAFAAITPAGEVIRLELALVDVSTGKETKVASFEKPLQVTFKLDPNADLALVGIYYISDSGELEYLQGTISEDGHTISVNVYRPGKYAVLEYNKSYVDLPVSHWAHRAVKELSAKHIVNGVSSTKFAPELKVTRAEFAALLTRLLGLAAQHKAGFADVEPAAWYAEAIAAAAEAGIIRGVSDSAFAPDRPVTREEMATMLVRAYSVKHGETGVDAAEPAFKDQKLISAWAAESVSAAYRLGLVKGNEAKLFHPQNFATRAEADQMIYNLLKK
ncbi:S-layer homology domain-containing protein [Paenibacillus sp. GCM10027626]|uniref:S-layer homology domain-containing protein n=1 Tax=Paenibacillus sp. GCM10027626 TaxID=3273411 RepID=UPI00363DAA9C